MQIKKIQPFKGDLINVIIETPRGATHKYTYDEALDVFTLKKTMPLGFSFPFDFGFIPNTKAEDGDPIDVLVMLEQPALQGCLVACRLLGVLEATQKERDGIETRNDRLIAVVNRSILYAELKELSDISKTIQDQIAIFFVTYNMQAGKTFTPLRWSDTATALQLIRQQLLT